VALPKQKQPREKKSREDKSNFDPYWTNRKVDSEAQYIQDACREPKGFFRGARIR
jgi:hypothetical protein